jgi:hypothetical protein
MSDGNAIHAGPPEWKDDLSEVRPPQAGSSLLTALRVIGLVGTAAVVAWQTVSLGPLKPRQEWGFAVLIIAGAAVGLTLFVLLPNSTRRLLRHKDILIPLGLYIPAVSVLSALAAVPAMAAVLNPAWPLKLFTITVSLSLLFAIQLILGVIYAGWTTALVLQAVCQERVDPVGSFTDIGRWFLRVLGAEFIGWAVLFACLAVAIALGPASIGLALFLIGVSSLVWNLATPALLPVVVAERGSFGAALAQGIRVSWRRKGRWWLPVVVQMILLGWLTFIHVSYTSSPRPGTLTTQTRTNWQVSGFWMGGYEDNFRWYTDLMKAVEAEPLPPISSLLELLFAVLAIVVKLRIVAGIYAPMWIDKDKPGEPDSGKQVLFQQ